MDDDAGRDGLDETGRSGASEVRRVGSGTPLRRHLSDQVADTPVHRWPPGSSVSTREPGPVAPEASSVPTDDGLGLDEDEDVGPP